MHNVQQAIADFWRANVLERFAGRDGESHGQTLVEYSLILALIALVVIGVVAILGGDIESVFSNVSSAI